VVCLAQLAGWPQFLVQSNIIEGMHAVLDCLTISMHYTDRLVTVNITAVKPSSPDSVFATSNKL
jgi:hypothetical protein